MENVRIITNHAWRDFKYGYELPDGLIKSEFDWLDEDEATDGFISYRGRWYHLSEFMHVEDGSPFTGGWDGYLSDSFFSGVLIRTSDGYGEKYQIATYIA